MFYTVYKTTNLVNGKIYIGIHRTKKPNDNYLGSGKNLLKSVKKYGKQNFKKEVLKVFDNPDDMFEMESTLVNEDFVRRSDTYNKNLGGHLNPDAWELVNELKLNMYPGHNEQWESVQPNGLKTHLERWDTDEKYRLDCIRSISKGLKKHYKNHPSHCIGRRHTEKTKKKIGTANAKYQKGSGNSQFGTCWIFKEGIGNKKVKKDEIQSWLDDGWIKGRKQNYTHP